MTPFANFVVTAVLFDLDGVLVDSAADVERAWTAWAAVHSLDVGAVLEAAHGRRTVETIGTVAPHLDAESAAAELEDAEIDNTAATRPMEGARELLAGLPQNSWAIVTSGTRRLAEGRITGAGLPRPDVLVTASDVTSGKPDPEGYLAAARHLGADPARCLVVEDTPAGITAAKAGGMSAVGVASTYPAGRLQEADAVVEGVSALAIEALDGALRVSSA